MSEVLKLNSPAGTAIMQRLAITSSGLYSLSVGKIRQIEVPLPPLAEQCRIVARVDELMALCDQLEAAKTEREQSRDRLVAASLHRLNSPADTAETDAPDLPTQQADAFRDHARFVFKHLPRLTTRPEHIKQLRQTILNLAVRGKLVEQDPNDEPAAELLKRIQAEKARLADDRAIKRLKASLPIDSAEVPSPLPEPWVWVRLGDLLLGDSQNGYSKKPDDAIDGIPILRISAGTVRKDGIVAEEEHKLIGGVQPSQQEQYQLQPGDLLACRFNGNRSFVGRLALYLGYLGIKPIYPDKLIRLRLLSGFVLPKLVGCFAESSVVRRDIEGYCATTVGNWGISASNLKEVKIPLPPIAEQHRIVARVDELMALCDQLEAQLAATEADSRRLLEAVLHEVLAPELEKPYEYGR
jgi:type I restriction enzyme S subunit